jgi:cell division septation protein DedD/ribosomal protein S27E
MSDNGMGSEVMKVTCPKCQFENQVNTPSQAKTRLVCARCATIIEVTSDQGAFSNGLGPAALPPLASNPDLQPLAPGRDPYATRLDPEFDEVLEIPLAAHTDYHASQPAADFEDVFTTPSYNSAPEESASDPLMLEPDTPPMYVPGEEAVDDFQAGFAPLASDEPFEENFTAPEQSERAAPSQAQLMGWPVLSDDTRSFQITKQPRRSNVWMQVLLILVLFSGLGFLLYYFFGDLLLKRGEQTGNIAATQPANPSASGAGAPAAAGAAPAVERKAADTAPASAKPENEAAKQPPAAAGSAAQTAPPSAVKPNPESKSAAPSEAAAKRPAAPLEVPFGHAIKPSEGSFTLQVASFSEASQAQARVALLKSAGVEARMVRAEIPQRGTWYRVHVGRFTSREEANRYGSQLKAKGAVEEFMVAGFQNP